LSAADQRLFVEPEDRDIGMVFQSYAIWPHMTVFDNVAFPLTHGKGRRVTAAEVASRVRQVLELVDLLAFERHAAATLSGGQQQRVALARALIREPKLLLMDEPLSNLDARLRDSMRTQLKQLTLALAVTTLYVTHDQIEALSLGDRICVMRDGRILQQGPPEEVYNDPADVFVAGFVGDTNFIPATIATPGVAETALGRIACAASTPWRPGDAVTLAIRPEQLELADGLDTRDVVEGRLSARLFVGDAAMWSVEVSGLTLLAKVPGAVRALPGQAVRLRLPRDRWHVFPGAPSADAGSA
jgi:iron(III) transport system ATP-binding protein